MGTVGQREVSRELIAVEELEEAAAFLDLERWIVRRLRQCEREVSVNLEVIRDDGEPAMFRGVRIQHSTARGPCMGPLIFSKEMFEENARAQAMQLTWQSALWGAPFGGSVGWIGASLEELSERESRLLTKAYVESMNGIIGSNTDVITPQRGGHRELSAWELAALGRTDHEHLATIMGKPISLGGVAREKVAASFLRAVVANALRESGFKLAGVRVAISGFDAEARAFASEIESAGTRVIAVSDQSGAIFHPTGLDVSSVIRYVQKEEVVFGYLDGQAMSEEDMLQLPADVLVLSAGHTPSLPKQARIIVEAGGRAGSAVPDDRMVVPGVVADCGSRVADCVEWRKNACGVQSERELLRGLQGLVRTTWAEVWSFAQQYELTLQQAAMVLAVSRVAETLRMR